MTDPNLLFPLLIGIGLMGLLQFMEWIERRNFKAEVHRRTDAILNEDEAMRLARQEVAEIEYMAGLIPMPDHMRPAPKEPTPKSTVPYIFRGDGTEHVIRNACGEVLFTYYDDEYYLGEPAQLKRKVDPNGLPYKTVEPRPTHEYEVHFEEPLTARQWNGYDEGVPEVTRYHIGYVGQPCSICEDLKPKKVRTACGGGR